MKTIALGISNDISFYCENNEKYSKIPGTGEIIH